MAEKSSEKQKMEDFCGPLFGNASTMELFENEGKYNEKVKWNRDVAKSISRKKEISEPEIRGVVIKQAEWVPELQKAWRRQPTGIFGLSN